LLKKWIATLNFKNDYVDLTLTFFNGDNTLYKITTSYIAFYEIFSSLFNKNTNKNYKFFESNGGFFISINNGIISFNCSNYGGSIYFDNTISFVINDSFCECINQINSCINEVNKYINVEN